MRLKDKLARKELTHVFCLGQVCSPKLVELVGLVGGFDAVWLDLEHCSLTLRDIEEAARAARVVGLDSFVRLAPTDYASVMRPLEAGAGGVMAAQVRSAAEAADVVRWSRFHPHGLRGFNSAGADGGFGTVPFKEYVTKANAETFVVVQIERAEAVEDVDRIVATPGLDCLFVGPADLSQSLGVPGEWDHPKLWAAIERTAKAANAAKLPWAILPMNPAAARRSVDLGCLMLSIGFDVWAFQKGIKAQIAEYAEFFPKR